MEEGTYQHQGQGNIWYIEIDKRPIVHYLLWTCVFGNILFDQNMDLTKKW